MTIYKYLNEKGALATIEKNSVLLKNPLKYNDPFDCLFYATDEEKEKAYELFVDFQLFVGMYDFLIRKNIKVSKLKMIAEKHRKDINETIKEIKTTGKFVSKPFIIPYRALIYGFLNKNKTQLQKEFKRLVNHSFEEMRSSIVVSCFGSSCDSVLMWSHYADKHKGACIEFETNDKEFREVKYAKSMPPYELYQTLELFFAHHFLGKEISDDDVEKYSVAYEPLLTKSEDWQYEGEVRCVYSSKRRDSKITEGKDADGNPALFLTMPKIKAIYIGCNATNEFKNKVKAISKDIPIIEMRIKEGEYGLEPIN